MKALEWGRLYSDLRTSHRVLAEVVQEYLDEIGGCDHSVNICACDEIGKLAEAHRVIAKMEGNTWCSECGAGQGNVYDHNSNECPSFSRGE